MRLLHVLLVISIASVVVSQDYQDYEPPGRAAPSRPRQNIGASEAPKHTPVAILKQINRHNEDGSYTYGYEGGDGSFKIETKLATGEVKGKYGYVDETGKVRVVEYGANKYGFQPSGEGITVAPPTLVDETTNKARELPEYEDEIRPARPYARPSRPQLAARPIQIAPQPRITFPQYDDDLEQESPRRPQYSPPPPPPQPSPLPQRAQVPNTQNTDVLYSPQQRAARPDSQYSQSVAFGGDVPPSVKTSRPSYAPIGIGNSINNHPVRPVVEQPQYNPPPRPQSSPSFNYRPQPPAQGRSPSVLDQLAKDYALPQSDVQALHDISFGYY